MPSRLTEIVENKKVEVEARKAKHSLKSIAAKVKPVDGNFARVLRAEGTNLICELKPKSPSAGVLKAEFNVFDILPHYEEAAAAISVLTDHKYFGGSLELLAEVAAATPLPTLCKDYFIDTYQCYEARAAGAQAVLLIVKILTDELMANIHAKTIELGMTPVVEVQNLEELKRALALSPQVILINNRNLDTFEVSLKTTAALAPHIPDNVLKVSASGISDRIEIESLLPYCRNFLIGSSLMTASNLASKLSQLKGLELRGRH